MATASARAGTSSGRCRCNAGTWTTCTTRPAGRGQDHAREGGFLRRHRSVRRRPSSGSPPHEAAAMCPAAATAAGDGLGGAGAGRDRAGHARRQRHRRLCRHVRQRLPGRSPPRRARRLRRHGVGAERGLRSAGLHPGPARTSRHGRHRLLLLTGGAASGRAGAAQPGVRSGPGRRGHGDGHPAPVRGVQPTAAACPRPAAAGPSPTVPTAPAGPKAPGWSS